MEPVAPRESLPDAAQAAQAFKPKSRRLVITLAANVLLLVVMVGGPYIRGHLRTRDLRGAFAAAAACVLGGRPVSDPGLGLPHGAREHFAQQVLVSAADWPQRCDPLLAALKLPAATFLLPDVKTAELDVGATAELLRAELGRLATRPEGTRVPDRPLQALEKLRAALARHAHAAGVISLPEQDAIAFEHDAKRQVDATRVPLYAAADAQVWWYGSASELSVLALDRRGLSYVEVGGGGMVQRRASRSSLVSTLLGSRGETLVWAMSPKFCAERSDGCARKASGIAPLTVPFEGLPAPRWLGSHPAGRADRTVRRRERQIAMLAGHVEGGVQVRAFELPEGEPSADTAPLPAAAEWPVLQAPDGLLLGAETGAIAHTGTTAATQFLFQVPGQPAQAWAELPGGEGWAVACPDAAAGAIGTRNQLRLWLMTQSDQPPGLSEPVEVPTRRVVHEEEAYRDRVRMLCGPDQLPVAVVRAEGDLLVVVQCGAEGCEKHLVAREVSWFDALRTGREQVLVAYAGSGDRAQVQTRRLDLASGEATAPVTPDPCWADGGGMCGLPRLLDAGERILLGAREATDMRVMQSADGGHHWTPMRGLRKAATQ